MFVVCDEYEFPAIKELVELEILNSINDCQSFLLYLAIATLGVCQYLRCIGNWAFGAISVAVEPSPPPKRHTRCRDALWDQSELTLCLNRGCP